MVPVNDTAISANDKPTRFLSIFSSPTRRAFDFPAAILTGLAMALAFSGKDRFWVAWVALIPALCVLHRSGLRRAFSIGATVGTVMSVGSPWYALPFVTMVMLQSAWTGFVYMLLLACFFALFFAMLFLLIRCLIPPASRQVSLFGRFRSIAAIAALWIAFEYGYADLLMRATQIFAMAMGYSQWNHPSLIQLASLGGVHAVSFLIVAFNVAIADDLCRVRKRFATSPWVAGLVILNLLGGHLRLHAETTGFAPSRSIAVAVLQGNIPAFSNFNRTSANFLAHRYLDLGNQANQTHPDLIVWTEGAVPWPLQEDDDLVTTMLRVTEPSYAYHILGAAFRAEGTSNAYFNSVFFVHPNGDITAQYDKRRLLSFVEATVPIPAPILSALRLVRPSARITLSGTRPPILDSPLGRIGVVICNENEYSPLARESAGLGAEFLVSPANDFWFRQIDQEAPTDWHFAVALFRAVETRRDLIIANNIGISAIIDAYGRILTRSTKGTSTCLSGRVNRRTSRSFYVVAGDLFSQLCACLALVALIRARFFPPREIPSGAIGAPPDKPTRTSDNKNPPHPKRPRRDKAR